MWETWVNYVCERPEWTTYVRDLSELRMWETWVNYVCERPEWTTYVRDLSELRMWETWSSRQCPGSPRLPGRWGESHWRMPALPPNTGPCTPFSADCHTCGNHTGKAWITHQSNKTGGLLFFTRDNRAICLVNSTYLTLGTRVYLFACLLLLLVTKQPMLQCMFKFILSQTLPALTNLSLIHTYALGSHTLVTITRFLAKLVILYKWCLCL